MKIDDAFLEEIDEMVEIAQNLGGPTGDYVVLRNPDTHAEAVSRLSLEDIDRMVEVAQNLAPPIEPYLGHYIVRDDGPVDGRKIKGPAALHHPQWGMTIALLGRDGSYVALLHPDTYAEVAGITREELERRIDSGEIPSLEQEP